MGNYRPWGPHGPEASPFDVKPNPTPAGNFQNLGGADWEVAQPTTGGGGGATHPVSQIVFSVLMLPFVWMFWICLYPMTAAVGIVTGLVVSSVGSQFLARNDADVATFFGIVAGFAVIVVVSRIEYRMAENAGFRGGRHVLRLILLGIFAGPWFLAFMGDADTRRVILTSMLSMVSHPVLLLTQLLNPATWVMGGIVAVGFHFLLKKADRLRAFWHRRLRWIGLK
jgi:hypothetical protein